jgi:hypothetical protein
MLRNISYSKEAFGENLNQLICTAEHVLKNVDFDTMVGTGLSGALVVPSLARAMGKKWAIVRKPHENSHSNYLFEGEIGSRWLFVDDFIGTGKTRFNVIESVKRAYNSYVGWDPSRRRTDPIGYVGTYVYSDDGLGSLGGRGPEYTPADPRHEKDPFA